jgi:sugar/nucleoside kinase (ribokinase family)
MMKQAKIIVLGNAVADVVARPVNEVPRTGSLHPESVTFHAGGCAGNSATHLARLGVDAYLVTCLGQDAFGSSLLDVWQANGIKTRYIRQLKEIETGVSIVLVDSQGERRFISSPAANNLLKPALLPESALDGAFALHVAGFFAARGLEDGTLAAKLAVAQAKGVLTTLDPVGGEAHERRHALYPLLPHLDILLLNDDEGQKVTGKTTPEAMIESLLEYGVGTVILKKGALGSMVAGKYGALTIPAYPAKTIDSTGAGDAFVGTLLASLARGEQFSEAMHWASAAGAATVEAIGATGSWRGWEALEAVRKRARWKSEHSTITQA